MNTKQLEELVERFAAELGEHFDAVQIIVSRPHSEGGTERISRGVGNWYARQGMAHEFISMDKAQEIAQQINQTKNSDD